MITSPIHRAGLIHVLVPAEHGRVIVIFMKLLTFDRPYQEVKLEASLQSVNPLA